MKMSLSQNATINSRGFKNKLNEIDRLFSIGNINAGNALHSWMLNRSSFHYRTANSEIEKIRLKYNLYVI